MLIAHEPPELFIPDVEVAGCYIEVDNTLLLLQSSACKPSSGRWGLPAGKMEKGETPLQAASRELFEETGILTHDLQLLGPLFISKPRLKWIFHVFKLDLVHKPIISLSFEHQCYHWLTTQELETFPLLEGGKEVIEHIKNHLL